MNYAERFWSDVDVRQPGECWLWRGRVDRNGYSVYRGQRGHRVAMFLSGLPFDSRLDVDHRCENKLCVSPFCLSVMRHDDHARLSRARLKERK